MQVKLTYFIQLKVKAEFAALTKFGLYIDLPVELLDYLLADEQAEPNATCVHLLRVLDGPEHLKQVLLVLLRNSYASVLHLQQYFVLLPCLCNDIFGILLGLL